MNVILCGLPMCGKTTVGKLVAEKLGRPFVDTDELIEKAYVSETGKMYSCRQIYFLEGESTFRALERRQIESLGDVTSSVIALGGGALDFPSSVTALQKAGLLIYLQAAPAFIWQRMLTTRMPAYLNAKHPEQDFKALVEKRVSLYEAAAVTHVQVDDLSPEQIALQVIDAYERV
ncbi:MAG: shikimate kinase [Parachlamydiaceae bacterium]